MSEDPAAATEPIGGEMTMAIWINECDSDVAVGAIGFLVRRQNQNARGCPEKHVLWERPAHTNQSHEPRLHGWCGTTDNIAIFAEGLAKIVRVTASGRALLARVPQREEAAALESLGWPSLAE